MNTENLNPCPLERRVGGVDEATTPGTEGFGSSDSIIRRNTRSTASEPLDLIPDETDLRVIEFLSFTTPCYFKPAFNIEIGFKDSNGILNKIGLVVRISRQKDAPRTAEQFRLFVAGYHNTGFGSEDKPVNGVTFLIRNPLALFAFFQSFAGHCARISDHLLINSNAKK